MTTTVDPNYWSLLGVSPECDSSELKAAFRKEARKWHPDLNKKEGKAIVGDSKLRAEESAAKILNDAKAKSNEFLDDAKSKIEIEKKRAIKEIKEEVVDLSLELATKVLQRNVKDDDNSKFIKSSLEAVKVDEAKS